MDSDVIVIDSSSDDDMKPHLAVEPAAVEPDAAEPDAAATHAQINDCAGSAAPRVLEFHKQIVHEQLEHDGLTIMGFGLGIEAVLHEFVTLFSEPEATTLIVNLPEASERDLIDGMATEEVPILPRILNAEVSAGRRIELYAGGGCLFVTARVLLLDLLRRAVPMSRIRGVIVADAHKVTENSVTAFALHVFREHNQKAFIKAISDVPYRLGGGFHKVTKVMKYLRVPKLYLWPRFRVDVSRELERSPPEVVELYQDLTPAMEQIQMALTECISRCLLELKKSQIKAARDPVFHSPHHLNALIDRSLFPPQLSVI